MSVQAKREVAGSAAEARKAENDPESSVAIFEAPPNARVIEEFRRHVAETGKPDEWRYHARSHPAPDESIDIIVWPVEVPESMRGVVPMATCPICSPYQPKYYVGALAHFPREKKLRAIGIDCAQSHFGEEKMRAAKDRYQRRRDEEAAFDEVHGWLGQVPEWKRQNDLLSGIAREADTLRRRLLHNGTKKAWTHLLQAARDGSLAIYEELRVTKRRADGSEFETDEAVEVWRQPLAGVGFLRNETLIESMAANVARLLERIPLHDQDELLRDIVGTRNMLSEVREGITGVRRRLRETLEFTRSSNLYVVRQWTADHRSGSDLRVDTAGGYPAGLMVGYRRSALGLVTIPPSLLDPPTIIRPPNWS